jgi:hypothetical protein
MIKKEMTMTNSIMERGFIEGKKRGRVASREISVPGGGRPPLKEYYKRLK